MTKCWKTILTFWCRTVNMDGSRLNKKIICWSNSTCKSGNICKNWNFRVCKLLLELYSGEFCNLNRDVSKRAILDKVLPLITQRFFEQWIGDVNRDGSRTGNGGNKFRTYKSFKQNFQPESYCKSVFNRCHRGELAKFRSGTAPIAIETGRYNGSPLNDRKCFNCDNFIEDEIHVILHCPLQESLRRNLFDEIRTLSVEFDAFCDTEKLSFILANPLIGK